MIACPHCLRGLLIASVEFVEFVERKKACRWKLLNVLRDFVEKRRNHFTWPAPFCPEIDNHRLVALCHLAVKIRLVEINRC